MYDTKPHRDLVAPALIVAFDGWVSAGAAGTATADHLAADGEVVVSFASDRLYDYRVNRPILSFTDGIIEDIEWPETMIRLRDAGARDLLVLSGPEPNWNWQAFADSVADLAGGLGVVEQISLGGIPWAAPHTRPTILTTTASRADLLGGEANYPAGLLRVPASAASVLERAVAERGIPTVGFWARVPHYVAGVYYPAVVTLLERVARHLGIEVPLGSLVDDSAAQRRHLDAAVEDQPAVAHVVEQLEAIYDSAGELATGEEIATEIERFLRDRIPGADD
ncbi:MAG TPA: PAC2 family protein [Acidimicrobiia bacterium]|nr:PAC2 family protein [Acidimicrobiia bacterium]